MKSRTFRGALFIVSFILIIIIFYLINHQLVLFPIIFPLISFLVVIFLGWFLTIFETIEKNSAIRYWEIKQDTDTEGKINKVWIWNFICSFCSLFFSNLLISLISLFFLYKLNPLSNNDQSLLIFSVSTIVILIRLLAYLNREIAREIGKGFRYVMFPVGFTLFLWDFLVPLSKQHGSDLTSYIINKYDGMLMVLFFAVFVITSLEPIFYIFSEIKRDYGLTQKESINLVSEKLINKLMEFLKMKTKK